MAGDWIKMRVDLALDPAVISIAEECQIEEDMVVGKLHRLWSWADQQTEDGNAPSVTLSWIDRYICVTGFAKAMQSTGWLVVSGTGFGFPDFDKHNGKTGKSRALTAKRVKRNRNAVSVTHALPDKREDKREDKRDKKIPPTPFTEQIAEIVQTWNQAPGVCRVRKLDDKRKKHLETRLKELDWPWREAVAKFPLPCFSNSDGWKPDFDWFVRPDTCDRILEGKYDWSKTATEQSHTQSLAERNQQALEAWKQNRKTKST
jgi:hypothetical protein